MCKLIANLVGSDEQIVREMISRLEHASGDPGVDIRITSDTYKHIRATLRALGLDPQDTTGEELYHSLLSLTERHDDYLKEHYGLSPKSSALKIFEQTAHIMNRLSLDRHAWLLKPSAARRILKKNPPKHVLKLLHYRSVDSLLKRESPAALLAASARLESDSWRKQLLRQYRQLLPTDFEIRDIEVQFLPSKRWDKIAKLIARQNRTPVISSVELGGVFLLPVETNKTKGLTLLTSLLALRSFNEVRLQSSYLKLHQVQPNFGQLFIDVIYGNKIDHVSILGQPVHWQVVHRHYANSGKHPQQFQPHLQAEDLSYLKAESMLYQIEPALHFWHDLEYVGVMQLSGPISFNVVDNALNLVNNLPYKSRVSTHLSVALWSELYGRYLAQPSIEEHLLNQLDERLVGAGDFDGIVIEELELII